MAVTLARPEDLELVPAWIEVDEPIIDVWPKVAAAASSRPVDELVARALLLGLPIGLLPRPQWDTSRTPSEGEPPPIRRIAVPGPPTAVGPLSSVVVIDLSSLWAGPLCGSLLAAAGATVIKVESVTRPDGARFGPAPFFDLLNVHKQGVDLDLRTNDGVDVLRTLLSRADVVIEASRPRALQHLGIDPLRVLASSSVRVWAAITGHELVDAAVPTGVEQGPVKLIIDDDTYPALDDLAGQIEQAHRHGRAAAVHCVTRTAIVLTLAAWDVVGSRAGDRVEHGSVVSPEVIGSLVRHGITVVTQPSFIGERGDEYLHDVAEDLPHLYRCRSLLKAGIRVAGRNDAPYTAPDPWQAMRAAASRAGPSGAILGTSEAVDPAQALRLFLGELHDPGGAARTVHFGGSADLCLLRYPLNVALERLTAEDVAATVCSGRLVHSSW